MASKIDSSEGSFMAELEGMESKRLEAATDFAGKLEDRYVPRYTFLMSWRKILLSLQLVHYQFNTLHQPTKTLAWV